MKSNVGRIMTENIAKTKILAATFYSQTGRWVCEIPVSLPDGKGRPVKAACDHGEENKIGMLRHLHQKHAYVGGPYEAYGFIVEPTRIIGVMIEPEDTPF